MKYPWYEIAREISLEHVDCVKMYAPGVLHCVFDVRIRYAVSCDEAHAQGE